MSSSPEVSGNVTDLFEQLIDRLRHKPSVQQGTGFGAMPGLRVGNKIFVMLCRGELVVKLPRHRVDQLVADGTAARFEARRDGRLMKEWATIPPAQSHAWEALAIEALRFVGPKP